MIFGDDADFLKQKRCVGVIREAVKSFTCPIEMFDA